MPNRWERNADNVLVPKIPSEGIDKEDIKVLPAYSKTDDFGYATDAQVDLIYKLQVGDTLSYVASGTQDLSGATAGNTAGFETLGAGNFVDATKKLTFKARVQLASNDTELFAYIGCAETIPTAADPPVEADDFIGFTLVEWREHLAEEEHIRRGISPCKLCEVSHEFIFSGKIGDKEPSLCEECATKILVARKKGDEHD